MNQNFIRRTKKLGECIIFFIKYKMHFKRMVILNTPEHGNLGDQAIVEAEYCFFEKYFPDYNIFEVSATMWNPKIFKYIISKKDMVFFHAGGYLGDLWPDENLRIKEMMEVFKDNEKIIMPQSIYFKETENKLALIQATRERFNTYSNLYIFIRERNSFAFLQKEKLVNSKQYMLVPDIVLIMDKTISGTNREGVICCFRDDIEKNIEDSEKKYIEKMLKDNHLKCTYTDTVVPYQINKKRRKEEVDKKLKEFSEAKLVITDRLHGMIFAAITGTPCIALNNISGKVKGEYEWIKELPYIIYVEKIEESHIKKMLNIENAQYDKSMMDKYYDQMAQIITKKIKK